VPKQKPATTGGQPGAEVAAAGNTHGGDCYLSASEAGVLTPQPGVATGPAACELPPHSRGDFSEFRCGSANWSTPCHPHSASPCCSDSGFCGSGPAFCESKFEQARELQVHADILAMERQHSLGEKNREYDIDPKVEGSRR
jgi:hypothetical protein